MSAEGSEAAVGPVAHHDGEGPGVLPAEQKATPDPRDGVLVESDQHATEIPYEPGSRVPRLLVAFWVVALTALAVYTIIYLVPDLRLWGVP